MRLTASEQATIHFYEWEYLGRGYYHFDYGVTIEPPFRPFYHKTFKKVEQKDDGRIPSLFGRINKLYSLQIGTRKIGFNNLKIIG